MPKYLVCSNDVYHYFEDYCNGLLQHGDLILIKYRNHHEIPNDHDSSYYFCQSIPENFTNSNAKITLINTEQLTHQKSIVTDCNRGIRVVDYDHYQSLMTPSPNHWYLPYQFHESEDQRLQHWLQAPKIYDVAFCSLGSSRRQEIWTQLENRGLRLCNVMGWGADRDRRIAEAKILINIHHETDYQIFEHFRCDRWILAGQLVVSEQSLSDDLLDHKDLVIVATYTNLVKTILNVVENYETYYNQYQTRLQKRKSMIMKQRFERYKRVVNATN